jgi:D-aspartate ligase
LRHRVQAGAVVLGADYRALGIVRSLGRRGIPVGVAAIGDYPIATASRFTSFRLPWPHGDDSERVDYLLDVARSRGLEGWTLFPSSDATACLLARNVHRLSERFVVAVPSWEVLRWAYDKRLTYRLASDVGLAPPLTFYPADRRELEQISCAFPVILKPAVKESLNAFTITKAWRIDDRRSLLAGYEEASTLVAPDTIMVQELIPGDGATQLSYAALCQDGRPVASLVARRTRQYPMDFGRWSTYVETVEEPAIEEAARRLLLAMRMTGLVEVEFKRDSRDGCDRLLDVNARIWGWHTLGSRAGVDFPYALWREVHGEDVAEVRARPGVRWVWLLTDVPIAASEIARRRLSLGAYIGSLRRPLELAIEAKDDPLPGLMEIPLLAYPLYRNWRVPRDGYARHRRFSLA